MKRINILFFLLLVGPLSFSQNIAYMKMNEPSGASYLNSSILSNLQKAGLNVKPYSNTGYFEGYKNDLTSLSSEQINNLKLFNFDYIILHKSEKQDLPYFKICYSDYRLTQSKNWQSEFYIFNVHSNQFVLKTLSISTFDCGDKLESCSNINEFAKSVKDFVTNSDSASSNTSVIENTNSANDNQSSQFTETKKKKSFFGSTNATEGKFKVVRVKEKNMANNNPVTIDIYDKSMILKEGDNIIITKTDEVKIPGERKTVKSQTTIGKAKITEEFNKPLYTAKLISNAGFNMKDYKDGDENYSAVIGEVSKTTVATPKIMVIPKKIDPSKFNNGEYQLSKEEKILIAAFKNKFEDNKFTTYGFESSLKNVLENRQFNDNVQDDIKSKILEAAGMDFFVEYENLDQNNSKCDKVFDFKIRNYSTGEDVASDVKTLNSCGSPDDYKNFAAAILNSGAVSKINGQFASLLNNGRKVSVIFTISNTLQATFNKEYNGTKLKDHVENCLQGLAFNGNLDIEGVVNLRMETTVNIPIINEDTGRSYTTNTFSEDIISYLKKNANVECESSVSKQIVNIKIK